MRKLVLIVIILLFPILIYGQQTRSIKGRVLDQSDGSPLPGTTIFIDPAETQAKEYNPQGTLAGSDGSFVFTLPSNVRYVMVSFLGYEAQRVDVSSKTDFVIRLLEKTTNIGDVVVTGYQKIEKRKLTSSIASIDMGDIKAIGVASVDQMLEGQLAGVFSSATTGAPGAASQVKIRSTVTLNGNTEPLWVLDGIPLEGNEIPKDWSSKDNIDNLYNTSIAGLNPDDIESITILKDAAATSIYGARAANGVIIITSKSGKKNQSLRVNVSAAAFVTSRPRFSKLNLMNASEKVDLELMMASNGYLSSHTNMFGGVARILDAAGERATLVGGGGFGDLTSETQQAINDLRKDGTNWAKEIYRVALNQQYSVNVSGGGERATYYFSAGYYDEQGTTRGTGLERLNMTLKTDYQLLKNLKFGASIFVNQNKTTSYITDADGFQNPANYSRNVNPYLNAYDEDGNYVYDPDKVAQPGSGETLKYNFLEERENTSHTMTKRGLKSIFDLEYKPVKGLRLYTQFGLQIENGKTEKIAHENTYFVRKVALKSTTGRKVYLPKGGIIHNWDNQMDQYTWKAQAEYTKIFGNRHEMDIMGGMEMRGLTNENLHTKGFGYNPKTLVTVPIIFPSTSEGISLAKNSDYFNPYAKNFYENRYLSYFATGSYTYDNRYTFFGSLRYDGTNLFGVDPKYKYTPIWSVSASWNIHRETFLANADWLNNLRLRASYGVQGNVDRSTSPYIVGTWYNQTIGGIGEEGISVTSPPNQNLRWETTHSWNAAIDLGVLDNRLNMTFEVYGRRSKDLITMKALPLETGFQYTATNFGEIKSSGIELSINSVNIRSNNFRWETAFNIAHNTDEVTKMNLDDNRRSPSLVGHSASGVFGFKMAGLDDKGVPMFWQDGNKVTLQELTGFELLDLWSFKLPTANSDIDYVRSVQSYLGDANPKFTGGFNNKFYYRSFDLSISANFVINQMVMRTPFYNPSSSTPGMNYSREMLNVWSKSNPNGKYPALAGPNTADGGYNDWTGEYDYNAMYYLFDGGGFQTGANMFNMLDIWAKKMSYLRINSIRLGYTLPAKIVNKIGMTSLRLSFEARNPFVISTNYSGYFDPETYGNVYAQPVPRIFSFGVNISF